MYLKYFKRILDFVGALILMIILLPIFVIIVLLIKLDSSGSIFFRQERKGKKSKTFRVYKFRSMVNDAEKFSSGIFTDSKDARITKVGFFLRKFSLDELPQIINILLNDMSFIGPRPVPLVKLDNFDHNDTRRLAVKPGITGWAQVNGRNNLTWPQKIEKDLYYIENVSFLLDLRILLMTFKVILTSEGIYSGRYGNIVGSNKNLKNKK